MSISCGSNTVLFFVGSDDALIDRLGFFTRFRPDELPSARALSEVRFIMLCNTPYLPSKLRTLVKYLNSCPIWGFNESSMSYIMLIQSITNLLDCVILSYSQHPQAISATTFIMEGGNSHLITA